LKRDAVGDKHRGAQASTHNLKRVGHALLDDDDDFLFVIVLVTDDS
jgi:hypothetical protein